jgi:hypothetical protein
VRIHSPDGRHSIAVYKSGSSPVWRSDATTAEGRTALQQLSEVGPSFSSVRRFAEAIGLWQRHTEYHKQKVASHAARGIPGVARAIFFNID